MMPYSTGGMIGKGGKNMAEFEKWEPQRGSILYDSLSFFLG